MEMCNQCRIVFLQRDTFRIATKTSHFYDVQHYMYKKPNICYCLKVASTSHKLTQLLNIAVDNMSKFDSMLHPSPGMKEFETTLPTVDEVRDRS